MVRRRGGFRGGHVGEQGHRGFGSGKIRGRGRGRRMSGSGFMRRGQGSHGGSRSLFRSSGRRSEGGRGSSIPRGRGSDNRRGHGSFIPRGHGGMGGGQCGIGGGLQRQPTGPPEHSRFDRSGDYEANDYSASGYTPTISTESQRTAIRSDTAWKFRLVEDMKDPEKQLFIDDQIVIINDAYLKAERHFLVLPQKNISSLANIKMDDIALLKHMDRKGREIAVKYGGRRHFNLGYHAQPHMERLHLHVISDDMNSKSLKHLRHWNLFTTPLFMDSQRVIEDLKTLGKIQFLSKEDAEYFMKAPLKCHKCSYVPKHMSALKNHLLIHL